jgi:superfamily II DNA/RNA helicase
VHDDSSSAPEADFRAFAEAGLKLDAAVLRGLTKDHIRAPTTIQRLAFGPLLEGRHVVLHSGTGTGKTLAYLLPVLERLRKNRDTRAVVFNPATELAMQTLRVADRYKPESLKSGPLVTASNRTTQRTRIQKSTQLVIGTPRRILEQIAARHLKGIHIVVLDEPEPILAEADVPYLLEVLSRPTPNVQLVIATATLGRRTEQLLQAFKKPVERLGGDEKPAEAPLVANIQHS